MAGFANLRSLLYSETSPLCDDAVWIRAMLKQSPRRFDNIEIVHGPVRLEKGIAHIGRVGVLGGASICSGNFSMLRMLVAAGFLLRKILAPCRSNITHPSGKRESWHHPSVPFSDNAWIECYRSSPSRARRHQVRVVGLRPHGDCHVGL
jgi:hypothetical protein